MLRFDPFSDLDALTRGLLTSQTGSSRTPRFMPMDLCKIDDHYLLTADLPGVDPGSVDVDVDSGTLTISAHRTARSENGVQWLANERFFGTYRRQLSLGEGIDASAISATYENGVLTVTIPLAERAKPRKIDIAHGGGAAVDRADHRRFRVAATRNCGQIANQSNMRSVRSLGALAVAVQPVSQIVAHGGHSMSRIEYTTVSRRDPSGSTWWLRSMPSSLAPSRSIAARLVKLKKCVRNSTATQPNSSNAWPSINSLVSLLTPLRRADATYQVLPISSRRLTASTSI